MGFLYAQSGDVGRAQQDCGTGSLGRLACGRGIAAGDVVAVTLWGNSISIG
jgi:hypothetical protein